MRQLGMIGTTFRRTGQEDLRRYMLGEAAAAAATLQSLHERCGFRESVYLATCNRVEIIFVAPPSVSIAQCRQRLYRYFYPDLLLSEAEIARLAATAFHAYEGEGAAEHLFTVAASLDSMNPGEAQILGQVKGAYRLAQDLGLAGSKLAVVFDEAFAAAKKVRHSTKLGAGAVSMVSLAVGVVNQRLQATPDACLAVIGVGDMALQCGQTFGGRPNTQLLFVNRTVEKAALLAKQFSGSFMSLESFLLQPPAVDVIISATAAPVPFLDSAFFGRIAAAQRGQPLVVDLALQRDVEPQGAMLAGAALYDLDRLNDIATRNRREREGELTAARILVDEALDAFRRRLAERELGPVVRELRERFEKTMQEELQDLLDRVLPSPDAATRERVQRWAHGVVGRLAHVPTMSLKRVAFEHGMEAVETFLAGMEKKS